MGKNGRCFHVIKLRKKKPQGVLYESNPCGLFSMQNHLYIRKNRISIVSHILNLMLLFENIVKLAKKRCCFT